MLFDTDNLKLGFVAHHDVTRFLKIMATVVLQFKFSNPTHGPVCDLEKFSAVISTFD